MDRVQVAEEELRRGDSEDLGGVPEGRADRVVHPRVRRGEGPADPLLGAELVEPHPRDGRRQDREDLGERRIEIGMEDVRAPGLLHDLTGDAVERHRRVVLVEALLVRGGLAETREHVHDAPRLVEEVLAEEQLVELGVELRLVRVAVDLVAKAGDRVVEVVGDDEQLDHDLPDLGVVGPEARSSIERVERARGIAEAVAVDEPELVVERLLELRFVVVFHTRDHLPVGPLEALPVLRLRERADEVFEHVEERSTVEPPGGCSEAADLRVRVEREYREPARSLRAVRFVDDD